MIEKECQCIDYYHFNQSQRSFDLMLKYQADHRIYCQHFCFMTKSFTQFLYKTK